LPVTCTVKQEQKLNAPLVGMAMKKRASIMLTICQHMSIKMTYIHQQHYIRVSSKYVSWIKRYLQRNPLQLKNKKKELINPLEQELGVKCMLQNTRHLIDCTLLGMFLAENFKGHMYISVSQCMSTIVDF